MNLPKFKKIDIKAYSPGKSSIFKRAKIQKMSANESALGVSTKVLKFMKNGNINFSKYPNGKSNDLRRVISKKFKCHFDKIICGAGSDEIIQIICQLFLNKNDEVIVPKYSFLMYRIYSRIVGAKVIYAQEDNYKASVENILKKVNKKTKIVFLANPNNPTGTYLNKREILNLRSKLRSNVLLVIDDAYFEYMLDPKYKSGLELFKNSKNTIILRTFSKIHGLASLRVGWGYGPKNIIKEMTKIKPPFNVNKVAQLCAMESLMDSDFINKSVRHNKIWSKKLKQNLEKFNIKTSPISGNFFLLNFDKCKYSSAHVFKMLTRSGIILREMKSYGISNSLRLTIGNSKENKRFINKLNSIF